MDKIVDITKILEATKVEEKEANEKQAQQKPVEQKHVTNPIFKKLAKFHNENLSSKFSIKDLFR